MFYHSNILCSLFAVMAICIAARPGYSDRLTKWVILKECTVKVNGSTNVNKFTCTVPDYPNSDTITCNISNGISGKVLVSGQLALPVFTFDCANPMMTKDLRKTLKSKQFPTFYIHFISLEKYPALGSASESITGMVNIELAGVKKIFEVKYGISMDSQKIIHLVGIQSIYFSDFNLVPPRKLGGMIRTNDRLDVEFYINFRVVGK